MGGGSTPVLVKVEERGHFEGAVEVEIEVEVVLQV